MKDQHLEGNETVQGLATLQANFHDLPMRLRRTANKKAVRKGGAIVRKAARKNVKGPTKRQRAKAEEKGEEPRTGLLAKSLAVKVIGKANQPHATAIIGPRRDIRGHGYGGDHVPANIAHLVEGGHGGPHPALAHEFMRPAYDETRADVLDVIAETAWEEMKAAATKV